MRGLDPAAPDPAAGTRALHFGDLCTLIVSEGRLSGRDATMDVEATDFYKETAMKPQREWDDAKIRAARLDYLKRCADPERHLLGPRQEAFIEGAVRESAAAGRPWQLFGSQTVMAPLIAPRLLETLPLQPAILRSVCRGALAVGTSDRLAGPEIARQARQYLAMGKYKVPMNPASWDGFSDDRERVLAALTCVPGTNPVVLAGDSHNAWASEIFRADGSRAAVEFAGPAVTAIGAFEDIWSRFKVGLDSVC